jgi:hypothetical protein
LNHFFAAAGIPFFAKMRTAAGGKSDEACPPRLITARLPVLATEAHGSQQQAAGNEESHREVVVELPEVFSNLLHSEGRDLRNEHYDLL